MLTFLVARCKTLLAVAAILAAAVSLCNCAQAQIGSGVLPPPAPRSYQECELYKARVDNLANQQWSQAMACDDNHWKPCNGNFNCLARNGCVSVGNVQQTQCGTINPNCKPCGVMYEQSLCTSQNGLSAYQRCNAAVHAYLQSQQQSQAQPAAGTETTSGAVNNVTTIVTGGRLSPQPAAGTGLSNTDMANAYGNAVSIDFKGIAQTWIEQKVPEMSHVFDTWKAIDFVSSVWALQSGEPAKQVEGVGGVAKGLLDIHWGVYELNPLSVATSMVMIDMTTTLYGEAFNNLDVGMDTALLELSAPPTTDSTGNFYRTQAPISVAYVHETPMSAVDLSSSDSEDREEDVDDDQFLKILSYGQVAAGAVAAPASPSRQKTGSSSSDCHAGDRVCP